MITTYIISQHTTSWTVHRYGENVTKTASGILSEEAAIAIAVRQAKENKPSQVLKISFKGESHVVATFGDDNTETTTA